MGGSVKRRGCLEGEEESLYFSWEAFISFKSGPVLGDMLNLGNGGLYNINLKQTFHKRGILDTLGRNAVPHGKNIIIQQKKAMFHII